ncbi:MAG: hypothetical protein LBC35_03895 [Coriobacteriales bacterium]|nr:hypothetical protein [Coriobacteriales bacterium]
MAEQTETNLPIKARESINTNATVTAAVTTTTNAAAVANNPVNTNKDRAELPAFILGIAAVGLVILPIPFTGWLSLPAALLGFIFSLSIWQKARHTRVLLSNRTLVALVLSAFAIMNHLFEVIAPSSSALDGIVDLIF